MRGTIVVLCPLAASARDARPDVVGVVDALRSYDAAWNVVGRKGFSRSTVTPSPCSGAFQEPEVAAI